VQEVQAAGRTLGVELSLIAMRAVEDFEPAFATMMRDSCGGFLVPSAPLTNSQPTAPAELELKYRLPGIFGNKGMSGPAA
jgi:putative tryptophan/tyrosine transport system substrate-binding protein